MKAIIPLIATIAVLVSMPAGQAQDDAMERSITVVAREEGCEGTHTFCFEMENGTLEGIKPGDRVIVTFRNDGEIPHNLNVLELSEADRDHRASDRSKAVATSNEQVQAGDSETFEFTAPEGDGLYFWCDVAGHEQLGMWFQQEYEGAMGNGEGNGSPAPALGVAVAAIGAALLIAGRRHR